MDDWVLDDWVLIGDKLHRVIGWVNDDGEEVAPDQAAVVVCENPDGTFLVTPLAGFKPEQVTIQ
jgi:hypothetical protein